MEKRLELHLSAKYGDIEVVDRDTKNMLLTEELIGKRIKGIRIGEIDALEEEESVLSIYLDIEDGV